MIQPVLATTQNPLNIGVVGGGIGGLTAALCLARAGHHVEIFEQTEACVATGAGIQISPNASRVLHQLGLQGALMTSGFLPKATQMRSWRSGRVISETALGDAAVERYGAPYYHIHRGDLIKMLVSAATAEPNIALRLSSGVTGFEQDASGVRLVAGEHERQVDLLIGADGIHSFVRACLWGDQQADFTGNVAWRMLVPVNRLPDGLIAPNATVWWGPGKHFVHYLVNGGDYVNCVCVVEKAGWQPESWVEAGSMPELRADFAGWHRSIQELLAQGDAESLFKWGLFDRAPMRSWGIDRVSLLGDACHPTLPFMAQGAAMAIEDAIVLSNCLSSGADVVAALQHYEDLRKGRTASVQRGSRRNAKVFHLSGLKAWVRDRAAARAGKHSMDRLYRYDPLIVGLDAATND